MLVKQLLSLYILNCLIFNNKVYFWYPIYGFTCVASSGLKLLICEIFPTELRSLLLAFFYSTGTLLTFIFEEIINSLYSSGDE